MEKAVIRSNIEEDREATITRFMHQLNRNIDDLVELHHYIDMDDILHMAIKIKQLKSKGSKGNSTSYYSTWKSNQKNRDKNYNKAKFENNKGKKKAEVPKPKIEVRLNLNDLMMFNVLNVQVIGISLIIVQISAP